MAKHLLYKKNPYIIFFLIIITLILLPKSSFASTPFITTWDTTKSGVSASNTIIIPTFPGGTYNYSVDWGDSQSDTGLTGDATHTYATPGVYTVEISGTFPRIYFNNSGDKNKIISVEQWGTSVVWSSMANAFYGASNLVINASDGPSTASVTDMSNLFRDAPNVDFDVVSWDFSSVTNMSGMFEGAASFNNPNIVFWFAPVVTNMSDMFKNATSFNIYIGSWDVSSVTNMSGMFEGATSFNQDISNWNVSNVTNMSSMFKNATSFDQDISNWNVSNVTNMSDMFTGITLSISNYDALLADWSILSLKTNVILSGGNSKYCSSISQRASIINTHGWTITDNGTTCNTTSSAHGGGGVHYGCKDPKAINYEEFSANKPELCKYSSILKPSSSITPICPQDKLLTQKLKLGSIDGKYNSYTKGIAKEVRKLQSYLNKLGFNAGVEDGIFGRMSEKAVKKLQKDSDVEFDGYVGLVTLGLINNSCVKF